MLPHDFPPYSIVYYCFRTWSDAGTWTTIHDALRSKVRQTAGKRVQPTVAVLNSQSVKMADVIRTAARSVWPVRLRQGETGEMSQTPPVVDTLGLLLMIIVTEASIGERAGANES